MSGYRFEWLLMDIRNGLTLPDRWPENVAGVGEDDELDDDECTYVRWWEADKEQKTSGAHEKQA